MPLGRDTKPHLQWCSRVGNIGQKPQTFTHLTLVSSRGQALWRVVCVWSHVSLEMSTSEQLKVWLLPFPGARWDKPSHHTTPGACTHSHTIRRAQRSLCLVLAHTCVQAWRCWRSSSSYWKEGGSSDRMRWGTKTLESHVGAFRTLEPVCMCPAVSGSLWWGSCLQPGSVAGRPLLLRSSHGTWMEEEE